MKKYLLILFTCCIFFSARAQLKTAALFTDHMVLQRNHPVPVWGWAAKNANVSLRFNGQLLHTRAGKSGYWMMVLNPMKEGGPYSMQVQSGKEQLTYNDIMLGEVWLCSGQSNMELQLSNANGYKQEQKIAAQTRVRQFFVPKKVSLDPEKDLSGGQWVKADTNTIGNFTAVGYFMAKKLSQQLNVTIGIINCTWGGTNIEDWISKKAMLASPELDSAAKELPGSWDELKERLDLQLKTYVYPKGPVVFYTEQQLADSSSQFFDPWVHGNAPGAWEWMGKLYSYRGEGFMQHTISLDSVYRNRRSVISLGQTDADLDIYINGKLIQNGALNGNYQLNLPAGTWKAGKNSLLIDLKSPQKNPAWFGFGLNGAGNDIFVRFNDTIINLADAAWRVMPDLSKPYHFEFLPNDMAGMLYNSMVHPLIPFAIAGIAWYQGESNAARAYEYRSTFQLLISSWRSDWKKDIPFLFVQLPAFGPMQNSNTGSSWAELREAQAMALQLPATGMAVTVDVGEAGNLHPKNKADVGFRLADEALRSVYSEATIAENPVFKSADFTGGYATVDFKYAEKGLIAKDKYGYVKGFELAGADHRFYYAQAMIIDNNKIKVWCSQVPQPVTVRYAWSDAPIDANLFSSGGLPVAPFRSDTWKGITEGKKF